MANFADIQHEPLTTTVSLEASGDNHHGLEPLLPSAKNKKKREHSQLRKAPQAPKRFKSSYIMFFMAKQDEIKAELGPGAAVGDVSKRSSEKWKKLTPEERAYWDEKARLDKERYNREKANYTGPWQVPWKRAKKDPSAPKRPMSAFLYFSQDRRKGIKEANPGMKNTEISRILGEMWKEATDEERAPHIENEAEERKKYKVKIAEWKSQEAERKKEAKKALEERQAMYVPPSNSYHREQSKRQEEETYQIHPEQYHPQRSRAESPRPSEPDPVPSQRHYYQGYPQEYYHPPPTYGPPPPHYSAYQQPPPHLHQTQHHHSPYHPHPQGYPYDYGGHEYQHRPDVDDQSRRISNSGFPEGMPNDEHFFGNQAPPNEYTGSSFSPYDPQPPAYHYDNGRPPSVHSFQGDDF